MKKSKNETKKNQAKSTTKKKVIKRRKTSNAAINNNKNNKSNKKKLYKRIIVKGFTLVELLAVIVILGVLIGIAFPSISRRIRETRDKTYTMHEADMKTATMNLMSECVKNGEECVPNGESRTYYLS